VIITITIDPSWLRHGAALARVLDHIRALEAPAPYTPPAAREPGDDDEDLGQLLDGMDAPEPAAAASPAAAPRPRPIPATQQLAEAPTAIATGSQLYKWAASAKALPAVNRIGKRLGAPRLVTEWSPDQVAAVVRELTSEPLANGRPR
jgi:hypothetical protein